MYLEEPKLIRHLFNYFPAVNSLSCSSLPFSFNYCREVFHNENQRKRLQRGIYYITSPDIISHGEMKISQSLNSLEELLNLREYSTVQKCQFTHPHQSFNGCIYVQLSPFWTSSSCRAQFFTIALRSAHQYARRRRSIPFLKYLLKCSYFSHRSSYAARRFLLGYTLWKPRMFFGWVRQFRYHAASDKGYVNEYLVRPKKIEDRKYFKHNKPYCKLSEFERSLLRSK